MTHQSATLRATRSSRPLRAARAGLLVLAVLLAAAGILTVLSGVGTFGDAFADSAVIAPSTRQYYADRPWLWALVALGAAVVAGCALTWVLAQARSERVHALVLGDGHDDDNDDGVNDGRVVLRASALCDAVARDVLDVRGVGRSAAHIDGPPEDRRLRIAVVLDGREPVGRVHRDILATAVAHARTAMGERPLPIRVELDVPAEPRRDLR